jgi:hypothetical protein
MRNCHEHECNVALRAPGGIFERIPSLLQCHEHGLYVGPQQSVELLDGTAARLQCCEDDLFVELRQHPHGTCVVLQHIQNDLEKPTYS